MSNSTALSVLFRAAAAPPTVDTDRRAASSDPRHHRQLDSVLLPSAPREVRAQVCARLLARIQWRSSIDRREYAFLDENRWGTASQETVASAVVWPGITDLIGVGPGRAPSVGKDYFIFKLSTLFVRFSKSHACRCVVSVPAPDWGLSNRVCCFWVSARSKRLMQRPDWIVF